MNDTLNDKKGHSLCEQQKLLVYRDYLADLQHVKLWPLWMTSRSRYIVNDMSFINTYRPAPLWKTSRSRYTVNNIYRSRYLALMSFIKVTMHTEHNVIDHSGVDPGFSVGGGANPPGGGHQNTNVTRFPQKLHGIMKFCSLCGAHGGGTPFGSVTAMSFIMWRAISKSRYIEILPYRHIMNDKELCISTRWLTCLHSCSFCNCLKKYLTESY